MTALKRFSSEEFSNISRLMQNHHSLFYEMWSMGKPIFDDRIPTACITFNKEGKELDYRINPDFWQTLTEHQKCFVIGHECLHGVLNHGIRANVKIDMNANKAMDLVVNHTLVNGFGFDRQLADPTNKYCWIDTVLGDSPEVIKENESFEYYMRMVNRYGKEDKTILVDFHDLMEDSSEFLKELGDKLSDEVKEQLKDFVKKHIPKIIPKDKQAGKSSGGMEFLVPYNRPKKKKKWETVIKKWTQRILSIKDKDLFQWARTNRRFSIIESEMIIPSEMEMEDHFHDERKILVWFFQDTSGSCAGYRERFFTAAESLPTDRFDVKMHCFDTEVYETTLASRKLYGFGGTSYSCIEDYIQSYCSKNHCKYPEVVFVVTDGYGNNVMPEKPKKWFWFLSQDNREYIPETSKVFLLENYE